MEKIKNLEELKKLKEELKSKLMINDSGKTVRIRIALATCGIASGAKEIYDFFISELPKRGIDAIVTQVGCMGYCYAEPTIEVILPDKEPVIFGYVNKSRADEIIEKYIKNGQLIDGILPKTFKSAIETPMFL